MQKTTIFFVILMTICMLQSCTESSDSVIKHDEVHLQIDPNNLPPFSKLSELVTDVRILPLETSEECLIGSVGRFYVGKNDIILVGHNDPSQLMRFSLEGRFLNFIGREGPGPGEYRNVWGITPFEDSAVVYVNMQHSGKVFAYSYDGVFLHEQTFPRPYRSPTVINRNLIAVTSSTGYEVRLINTANQDTVGYIKTNQATTSRLKQLNGDPQNGYFYTALGRDTIWRIDSESMRPQIVCDFGSGHFSSKDYFASIMRPGGYPPGHLSIGGGIVNGSGFYHFTLLREDDQKEYTYVHVVVNGTTHQSWHLYNGPQSDDILFCASTDFRTVANSGEWVSVVAAYELTDAYDQIKANKSNFNYPEGMMEQIMELDEEANSVLVFYRFK